MNTILGEKVEVRGDIHVKSGILVHGIVEGNITSTGTVRTAEGSKVVGKISAVNVIISGKIKGDVIADNKIVLGEKSVLIGNLKAKILVIEEGSKFDGLSYMTDKPVQPETEENPAQD